MSVATDLIQEFGRTLGMDGLRWDGGSVLQFDFELRGTLFVEPVGEDLLVYLRQELDPHGERAVLTRALRQCHYRQGGRLGVQAGLSGETGLVFSTRLRGEALTLPGLESALEVMSEMHRQVRLER